MKTAMTTKKAERAFMTWNVRIYDIPGGKIYSDKWRHGQWLGVVDGRDEQEARHAALSRFDIPADCNFEVSPR